MKKYLFIFLLICVIAPPMAAFDPARADDAGDYADAVLRAQAHALAPTVPVDWRASSLIIVPDSGGTFGLQYDTSGNLIVRSASKASNFANDYVGEANYKIFGQPASSASFVTTGNDFTRFYDSKGALATNTDLINFVERSLGIFVYTDVTKYHNAIIEFTVNPTDNYIMRPTKNPDIKTVNQTQYGSSDSSFPFQKPSDMSNDVFNNFKAYYNSFKSTAYSSSPFPWTQLGYTYYWTAVVPTQLSDIQGDTEFIILGQTPVNIYSIYSTVSYIYTKNNGQYGNGYANFNIDGACDTVWAGHSFQKNVSYSAASPNTITITGPLGDVSGGEGILVWSLNYTINNSGTISSSTRNKFGVTGTSDIAIFFEGDTSASYGTPITSGINTVINSGTIGTAGVGTGIYIANGDTTITNSGTITAATAVDIGGGTTNITNTGTITGDIILEANPAAALDLGSSVLTYDGDYIQRAGSTLKATVNSTVAGNYGAIDISASLGNTATLSGILKTTTNGTYALGDTLASFIKTAGGVSGTFNILDTPITPTIIWKPLVNGTNLDLVATRDYNNYPLRLDLTNNQQNTAGAMESILPSASGDLATVKNAVDGLVSNSQVADAYSQVSPERFSGMTTIAFTNTIAQFNNLENHLEELRTGMARGMAFDNFTGRFAGNLLKEDRVLIAYNGDDWAKFARQSNKEAETDKRFGFFINGEGNFGTQDATDNQPGFNYASGGVTAGFDCKILDGLIAGINAGYTGTGSKLGSAGGNIDADSVTYGIYGTYSFYNMYLDLTAQFVSNFYHTDRKISFGGLSRDAKASPFGQLWNLAAGTGFDLHAGHLVTGPTATVKYSNLWIGSFTESGANSLDLDVASQTAQSCQMGFGWRAEYELKIGKYSLFPQAHVSYQYEFLNDSRSIEADMAGATFDTVTDGPSRNFVLADCGIVFRATDSVLLNVGYQIQAGQRGYVAHNLNGGVKAYF